MVSTTSLTIIDECGELWLMTIEELEGVKNSGTYLQTATLDSSG